MELSGAEIHAKTPLAAPRACLGTMPTEITSRIVELVAMELESMKSALSLSSAASLLQSPDLTCGRWASLFALAEPRLTCVDSQAANLSAPTIFDLVELFTHQLADFGRYIEAVQLGDTPPSSQGDQIPTDIESITGLRPPRKRAPLSQWRLILLSAILPLLPNVTRLSFDVAMVEPSWNLSPLLKAIGKTEIQELVIIQAGVRRQVHGGDFWIVPELIELLPLLRKLTFRITAPDGFSESSVSLPALRAAMGSLKYLEFLTVVGEFDLIDTAALSTLRSPLEHLVRVRGTPPYTLSLVDVLERFKKTLQYVRTGKPAFAELKALMWWCWDQGIGLRVGGEKE